MKIIDAVWEKTNLGVESCKEIVFDIDDDILNVEEDFRKIKAEYLVVKVPSPRVDLLMMCQENGYKFIETNVGIKKNLKSMGLPKEFQRFEDKISYRIATDNDKKKILLTVQSGIFVDDKIALDSVFGLEKSATRYYNWIQQIILCTGKALIVSVDKREVGFMIVKVNGDACEGTFAGLFTDGNYTGFGFALAYATFLFAKDNQCKFAYSGVSTNNLSSLRMNLFVGYEIEKITYNLIKHDLKEILV